MSMLAEPRRKANYVLNPKNTHWSSDNSKFGLRLMEKMGWTEGSGLGANEQGSTEHIKVSVRSDNRGVGFKDRPEDELVHQSEFSDLLQHLASNTPPLEGSGDERNSAVVTSLEEKSEKSRSRVHYKKFTRGKDLSRYSEKDLASILGKPAPVKSSATGNAEIKESIFESDVNTIGGGNMFDYFKKKKAGFRSEDSIGDTSKSEEICSDNARGEFNGTNNTITETNGVKKKKKSKRESKHVEDCTFEAETEGVRNVDVETRKERKRRRKAEEALNISEQEIDIKNSNNAKVEDSMNCKQNLSATLKDCDDASMTGDAETKKEKKRRRKAERAVKILEQQVEMEDAANLQVCEINENSINSKQKLKPASDHRKQDEEDGKIIDIEAHANKKKEKKRKQKFEGVTESSQGKTEQEVTTNSFESSSDQKSNKLSTPESVLAEDEDNSVERKLKKQKHNTPNVEEDKKVENEMEITESNDADNLCGKVTKKKKSKKSRKECDQGAIELEVKNDVNSSKIKNKKSKRKLEDDVDMEPIPVLDNLESSAEGAEQEFKKENRHKKRKTNKDVEIEVKTVAIPDSRSAKNNTGKESQKIDCGGKLVGSHELKNSGNQMPIGTEVNEPEDFWDARSKKAKKKEKLEKLSELSEHVPESLSKCLDDVNKEDGYTVEVKNEMALEIMDQEKSDSKTIDDTTEDLGRIECAIKEKKENKSKRKKKEALCSDKPEETTPVLSEPIECCAETKKERKRKRKDKNPSRSEAIEETSEVSEDGAVCAAELTEEMIMRKGNQGLKDIENVGEKTILRSLLVKQNDVVEAEKVDEKVNAELTSQRNVSTSKLNVAGSLKTGVHEQANVSTLNQEDQISRAKSNIVVDNVTQNNSSSFSGKEDAPKKPIPIVELNGKVYLNGICNFDLSHPEINNVELKKIPLHMRQDVEFLPIPGANVDEFGYIGLEYHK